jgi:hypothetical protein
MQKRHKVSAEDDVYYLSRLAPEHFSSTAQDAIVYWFDTDPSGTDILHMS